MEEGQMGKSRSASETFTRSAVEIDFGGTERVPRRSSLKIRSSQSVRWVFMGKSRVVCECGRHRCGERIWIWHILKKRNSVRLNIWIDIFELVIAFESIENGGTDFYHFVLLEWLLALSMA